MKKIFTGNIYSWCDEIEESALVQIQNLSDHPLVLHTSIMPDCHCGYGMPIGGVIATRDGVIPNAVGVDIGCGMRAVQTTLEGISDRDLRKIMGLIRERVPVGFNHKKDKVEDSLMPRGPEVFSEGFIVDKEYNNAKGSLGTLGGGNHFIEIQQDENGLIWFMIHSGSRNLGYKVAKHYNTIAYGLNRMWYQDRSVKDELAFLPKGTKEYDRYLAEMNYCLLYAEANRRMIAERVISAFLEVIGEEFDVIHSKDVYHNYAAMEHHKGHSYLVHRKGATRAREGEIGIIPGSQGTASYIVQGKGNVDSLMSCSHGAGRKMSRAEAKKTLSLDAEIEKLDEIGVIHSVRHWNDLDEAPGSYKDIEEVMRQQEDLVSIVHKLKPLGVIKG